MIFGFVFFGIMMLLIPGSFFGYSFYNHIDWYSHPYGIYLFFGIAFITIICFAFTMNYLSLYFHYSGEKNV